MIRVAPNYSGSLGDRQSQSASDEPAANGRDSADLVPIRPQSRPRSSSTVTAQARRDRDQQIIDSINVESIAEELGFEYSSPQANASGWRPGFSPFRKERRASAAIFVENGQNRGKYKDFGAGDDSRTISFFEFASRLQPSRFPTWRDARDFYATTISLPSISGPGNPKPRPSKKKSAPRQQLAIDQLKFTDDPAARLVGHYARQLAKAKQGTKATFFLKARPRPAQWPTKASPASRHSVLAFPAYDPADWESPLGYILYRADGQAFPESPGRDGLPERKVHTLRGSVDGLIVVGTIDELQAAKFAWKCEGLPDAVALAERLPAGHIAVTNILGAGSFPDYFAPAFKGKLVLIAHDADSAGDGGMPQVIRTLAGSARAARRVRVSGGTPEQPIKDLRDHFAAGHTMEELLAIVRAAPDEDLAAAGGEGGLVASGTEGPDTSSEGDSTAETEGEDVSLHLSYQRTPIGMLYISGSEEPPKRLTTFGAEILEDICVDDGVEIIRRYKISVQLGDRIGDITISANKFDSLAWASEAAGTKAVPLPGRWHREHAGVAIRMLSSQVIERQIYGHTGWRQIGGQWLFLTTGGAISANGLDPKVEVELPESLARYKLPEPPVGDSLIRAVKASLAIRTLCVDMISIPVLAATYRAPLGRVDNSIHLVGSTGKFKTELAVLCLRHFGPTFDSRNMTANWASTDNALEDLASRAKDVAIIIDDFAPTGSASSIHKYHEKADRIFRGAGNGSGRQRMQADTKLRATRVSRGMIVSTGEEIPIGESLRARLTIAELKQGDIKKEDLEVHQSNASDGLFAQSMAAYVQWLAPQIETIQTSLESEIVTLRKKVISESTSSHARTPSAVASLAVGWRWFLRFALAVGAIDQSEYDKSWQQGFAALKASGALQGGHQQTEDPATRFLELIASALTSGRAHLVGSDGAEPADPIAYGWRKRTSESRNHRLEETYTVSEWRPGGDCIGHIDGAFIFLDPDAAYTVAQRLAQSSNSNLPLTTATLAKRMHQKGAIIAAAAGKGGLAAEVRLTHRRAFGGERHRYWKLGVKWIKTQEAEDPDEGTI